MDNNIQYFKENIWLPLAKNGDFNNDYHTTYIKVSPELYWRLVNLPFYVFGNGNKKYNQLVFGSTTISFKLEPDFADEGEYWESNKK
jgi:hypothetical protein